MICENVTKNSLSSNILDFVKERLRITSDSEDDYLTGLIEGVISTLTKDICYSPIANDYKCTYNINLINSTLIVYEDCICWLRLPIIYPFNLLNEIKINDEVQDIDSKICDYFIQLDISSLTCLQYLCIELNYNAGIILQANIPSDILLLIALKTEKLYDCECNCNQDMINNITNNYNKKRFM